MYYKSLSSQGVPYQNPLGVVHRTFLGSLIFFAPAFTGCLPPSCIAYATKLVG